MTAHYKQGFRIELSAQGGKPFAYYERPDKAQALALVERLKARHNAITVTVKEAR